MQSYRDKVASSHDHHVHNGAFWVLVLECEVALVQVEEVVELSLVFVPEKRRDAVWEAQQDRTKPLYIFSDVLSCVDDMWSARRSVGWQ